MSGGIGLVGVEQEGSTPNGYQRITDLSIVRPLTVPAGSILATVIPEVGAVRFRLDGGDPTATQGLPLALGSGVRLSRAELAGARFIQQAPGAVLNVTYGK